MPYIGNGMYQINNQNTGETKTVPASELGNYGLTPLQNPTEPNSVMGGGQAGQIAHNVSNAIPDWLGGGYIRSLLGAGYEGSRAIGNAVGAKNMYTNQQGKSVQDPFLSNQDLQNYTNPASAAITAGQNIGNAESMALPYGKGGILARLGIGAAGGALNSIGDNPGQAAKNTAVGAGLNAISPILGIFGKGQGALEKAGNKMNSIIAAHDANPETGSKVMQALQTHFGTAANPNLDLLPNAPAQETGNLKKLLQKEITSAQSGDLDHSPTLRNIQQWKTGSGAQGKYNNNTTSATNMLFRNISNAYGNVAKDVAPEIAKPYADYAKALNSTNGSKADTLYTALNKAYHNPLLRLSAVLGTGYAGLRGEGKLLEAPIKAIGNFFGSGWGGSSSNQSGPSNNGW